MLLETCITFIFRGMPESLIHMFGIYAFSDEKLDRKKYLLTSILLAIALVMIRKLPISYGIHTMLVVMSIIGLGVIVNKLNIIQCINGTIFNLIIQFLSEGINVFLISKTFQMDIDKIMSSPIKKVVYGFPSLIFFWGCIFVIYKINRKRKYKQNV